MEPKRSKYDTNPLDDRVADRAEKSWSREDSGNPSSTAKMQGTPTREIDITNSGEAVHAYSESEAPTRRIDDKIATSYPSIFVPSNQARSTYEPPRVVTPDICQPPPMTPPSVYQPPRLPVTSKPGSNTVSGLGIPERWAAMLPYLPFYLAIVIAIVELLLVPRTETRTRFHASQALAIQLGVTAVSTLLTFAGFVSGRYTGAGLFSLATSIFLIIAMVKVWKGKPVVLQPLDEPRKWLDEKIKPRK